MKTMTAFLSFLLIFSCQKIPTSFPIEKTYFIMDTIVRITVYDSNLSKDHIENCLEQTVALMKRMEKKTSVHIDTSDVARINRNAGQKYVPVCPETKFILEKAFQISEQTDGLFDISVGAVQNLWGFGTDAFHVPLPDSVQFYLKNVDYTQIKVIDNKVFLQKKNMTIELGGIAKGFIVDEAVSYLASHGIRSGIVEAGGDLRIFGRHPKRDTWRIGVKHPRQTSDALYGIIETREASVATSGDYERYFINKGHRYHHILDPRTGYPASKCLSVTIVAENALPADAYATGVFVMGPVEGIRFIENTPGIEGIIIYFEQEKLQSRISRGLVSKFQLY